MIMADDNMPSVPKRYKVTPDSEQYQLRYAYLNWVTLQKQMTAMGREFIGN